jgi:uncharacterized membrane protein (UPF0127 family)
MRFPIDVIYIEKSGRVAKAVEAVMPFKLIGAPLRAYYALELPMGAIHRSKTRVGDHLVFFDAEEIYAVRAA